MNEIMKFMHVYKKEIDKIAKLVPELLQEDSIFKSTSEGIYINENRLLAFSSYENLIIRKLSNRFFSAFEKENGSVGCPCITYKVKHKCSGTPCAFCAMHTFYQVFYKGRRIKVL